MILSNTQVLNIKQTKNKFLNFTLDLENLSPEEGWGSVFLTSAVVILNITNLLSKFSLLGLKQVLFPKFSFLCETSGAHFTTFECVCV